MNLTSAQLKTIASKLFLMRPTADIKLPVPKTTTGAGSLSTKLDPIVDPAGTTPFSADWGIGVIDFTSDKNNPSIWLHNEGTPWRIGSTGKIAIVLAAAQLREDVRAVQGTNILAKPEDFDELFATDALWQLSPVFRTSQMADKSTAPRISTIFDFSKTPVDFQGPGLTDTAFGNIIERLATKTGSSVLNAHLTWTLNTEFAFSERLWLAGTNSDNVGADSCLSEIGVAYVKAVQRAYGLFDGKTMHMLLNGPYSDMNGKAGVAKIPISSGSKVFYRNLQTAEMHDVTDAMKVGKAFTDQSSWEPGSTAALAAYMIAFVQKKFASLSDPPKSANDAFATIEANLSHGDVPRATSSNIANGVAKVAKVNKQLSKIGLLGPPEGEKAALNTEFAYLETQQNSAPLKPRKYGVVVTGITDLLKSDGTIDRAADDLTEALGKAIHKALVGP
jgi:hypothetical protein